MLTKLKSKNLRHAAQQTKNSALVYPIVQIIYSSIFVAQSAKISYFINKIVIYLLQIKNPAFARFVDDKSVELSGIEPLTS